jgi:uncharacterized lipoprotein
MRGLRPVALALMVLLVCGCRFNPWHGRSITGRDCHKRQDYQRAVQVAPLKVPPGLDAPNTQGALSIPALDETAPPPPGPREACLDQPPKWKPAPPPKGLSG